MTICQSRISPFAEVRRGRCLSASLRGTREIKSQKNQRTPDSILLKAAGVEREKETRTTAEKPQIRGAQWYNQAEAVLRGGGGGNREGAGAYSLFSHITGGGQKHTHLTATPDSLGFMFPQVSAKCLRKRSSVSTAVCVCACVCILVCVCACVFIPSSHVMGVQ